MTLRGTNSGKPMKTITLAMLRAYFAHTVRREILLNKLEEEIAGWSISNPGFKCWLFGSFLSNKPEPADIDVLLSAPLKRIPPDLPRRHKDCIHVKSNIGTTLRTKEQMVAEFNNVERNHALGIQLSVDEVVELVVAAGDAPTTFGHSAPS
jgi:hypothetical protein